MFESNANYANRQNLGSESNLVVSVRRCENCNFNYYDQYLSYYALIKAALSLISNDDADVVSQSTANPRGAGDSLQPNPPTHPAGLGRICVVAAVLVGYAAPRPGGGNSTAPDSAAGYSALIEPTSPRGHLLQLPLPQPPPPGRRPA